MILVCDCCGRMGDTLADLHGGKLPTMTSTSWVAHCPTLGCTIEAKLILAEDRRQRRESAEAGFVYPPECAEEVKP